MKHIEALYLLEKIPSAFFTNSEKILYYQFLEAKYEEFLKIKKLLTLAEIKQLYEIHHILPKHAGGLNSLENLIPLTPEDHALAHYYRYFDYKQSNDLKAWIFRKDWKKSNTALQSQKFHLMRKAQIAYYQENNLFFYNRSWQKEKGQKGGLKNTKAQKKARQLQGLKNQSTELKESLATPSLWIHSSGLTFFPKQTETVFELVSCFLENNSRKETLPIPLREKPRDIARAFAKLLRKKMKSAYGWTIQ